MRLAYSAVLPVAVATACMTSSRPGMTGPVHQPRRPPPACLPPEEPVVYFSGGQTVDSFFEEEPAPCPAGTALVGGKVCVDVYEAPNEAGKRPIVMVDALEAEAWCSERGKRLCTEDEWTEACEGPEKWPYPYGPDHEPGRCNDAKLYIGRQEDLLNRWPNRVAVREVERLWQGDLSGAREGCVSSWGVHDTLGNVEEWTRSRRPRESFGHVLKGRFWAGERYECQWGVHTHADKFRYYEVGFRCCSDPSKIMSP